MKKLLSVLLVTALVLAALPLTALPALAATSGDFTYAVISETDKTCEITGYTGTAVNVTVPAALGGYRVTTIGSYAFNNLNRLTGVTLPDNVETIEYNAFDGCVSLTSVKLPAQLKYIGSRVFYNCEKLTSIAIPVGVTEIGSNAFRNCKALTTVTVSEQNNSEVLPALKTTVGSEAFFDCTALTSVTLQESVTSIESYAFSGCTSLTSITLPDDVETIEYNAFYGCVSLTSVIVPASVVRIENDVFANTAPVTIYGYNDSYAETYAQEKGFTFIPINNLTESNFGVIVTVTGEDASATSTVLQVEKVAEEEQGVTYNITLRDNGKEIQPKCEVFVKIPVPAGMDGTQCKVYREEANGKLTDMHAQYQNGYMVFTTDHFSKYVVTTESLGVTPGDLNGDEKINAVDARWVLQAASGARTFDATQTAAADVNGDGKVNAVDARWILQVASGARTL